MHTRITELFGIEHPIIQGGMHFVGFAELAAAVSNAGGLGIITGLTQRTPEALAAEIRRCRQMTDKPFGVNLTFLPVVTQPDYPGYIRAIIEGGVRIVETAGNNPQKWLPALKEAGILVIHKCTSVRHSIKAQSIGCDAVSVDGFECGGHPGEDDVPNFILLPRAAEELSIPFVASGGMADGRSLVAALALGADGINMGTRFIATKEAPVHDHVKQALVAASELDTRLVMRPLRNTERVLKNAAVERVLEKERALGPALTFADIAHDVSGVYPSIMQEGQMDAGVWSCGMVAGLIHDIPTVRELIDRIMAEADRIIRRRLGGALGALLVIALSIVAPSSASAQLTDGAKLITPGARANAMGGSFVAVDDDATAAVINPAGVQLLSKPQFYVEFTSTAGDPVPDFTAVATSRASFFSLAIPVSDRVSIAITHNEPYFVSLENHVFCSGLSCRPVDVDLSGQSYSASLAVLAGSGWRLGATVSHDDVECDGNTAFCNTLISATHGTSVTPGALWQHDNLSIGVSGVIASEGSPLWDRFSVGAAIRPSSRFLATFDLDTIQFGRGSSVYLTEPHIGAEYQLTSGAVSWFVRGGGFTSFGSDAITDRGLTVGTGLAIASHFQVDAAYVTQRDRVVLSAVVRF